MRLAARAMSIVKCGCYANSKKMPASVCYRSLFRILCKYLFSEVAVQAVTELDNKAAHCHTPVPQWHRPFL
ncbi:hypothetical protein BvCms2774_01835 [Escherichia coli]|nr:hypothetical protein BvCms2774_01835 [Escherichia coli]